MTVHKITAGDGYTYLTRQVAAGDTSPERGRSAAEYYTQSGNPPGRWIGHGLSALGISGAVSEEQMTALFGLGLHPDAGAIMSAYRREHVEAGMTEKQLATVNAEARKAASLGRPYAEYKDLGPFDDRVSARLEAIQRETGRAPTATEEKKVKREEARRQRRAVAGFDLVFTPVASVSRLWGLDPRAWVQEAIEQAHQAARDAALAVLEEHAAHTRTGSSGQAQIETHGLIAAVFEHADNRLGEPNLHSHLAVSSKVLGVDGKWRALDARGLYRMTVAASELYNTRMEAELHARLGLEFEARPDTAGKREPVREIKGFPAPVLAHFTRRRAEIEAEYQRLVADFRTAHGRDPSLAAAHELAQRATLATRKGKKPPRAWSTLRTEWGAGLAEAFGPDALNSVMAVVPGRRASSDALIASAQVEVSDVAARVVAAVQERHATWTRWSVLAQAERELRAVRFASVEEQGRAVELVVEEALARWSLSTEPPELVAEPAALRRSDGSSVFAQHGAERYTSQAILDAEARLVDAARYATTVGVSGETAAIALADHELRTGRPLDAGQHALAKAFACDGRLLMAGIGPAGAGKTTAMKALADVIDAGGSGRLVPLATSASAAGVLVDELGTGAENLHKFLWEWSNGKHADALNAGHDVPAELGFFTLNAGDVVLVDEAGMAGTLNLDRLVQIAAKRGAVVRLLGDYRQLGAVESGGALRLIANESGAVELTTLYRFADPAEAEATLKIRVGDTTGLDFYQDADRIRHGSRQAMTERAYDGWKADVLAGRTALMAAATNADVVRLCGRARADRVVAKQVEEDGVQLHDGNTAGIGDWIVTRDNNRLLRSGARDFVKNGDAWTVVERHESGALVVEHLEHHGRVLLPSEYVAANVELLYATTAHRAQGTTVDACHALVTDEMGRENFYVLASRGRSGTILYVATHELASVDTDEHVDATRFDEGAYVAREILEQVVARETAELSATEQIRTAYAEAESLATLVPRYSHALDVAMDGHYRKLVEVVLPDLGEEIVIDPAWHAVVRALREAEARGWDVLSLLANTTRRRELGSAESVAQVISWRLQRVIESEEPVAVPSGLAPVRTRAASDRDLAREWLGALHRALGTARVNRARLEPAWPALVLAMRRADDLGYDPASLVNAAIDRRALREASSLSESLALDVHRHLDSHAHAVPFEPRLPAWLRSAPPTVDAEWQSYLDARAGLIRRRIDGLVEAAVSRRSAWAACLGEEPEDLDERGQWLHHVSTIAAYRDQYRVSEDDPAHPLGPYPERGRTGHRAYWIAAESLLALRGSQTVNDGSRARLAADRYRTLERADQERIAAELVAQLDDDWFGDVREPAADADQPVYGEALEAALVAHGHLDASGAWPAVDQQAGSRNGPMRGRQQQGRHRRTQQPRAGMPRTSTRTEAPQRQVAEPIQRPPQAPSTQPRGPRPHQ
ncbi:relaxase domain-containing protein [Actinospica sp. MGRD01-02]|uniref:Relaxase domain-containing protein n=1 Tax=Actinospica acidithermotolerans TaxID=2828514 RepID=A0A941ILF3_9ACTN|nr:MobF family relaxase [Actinospica acidithermotolerans]MBR7827576.1 relaxase domain-containing protein [Actinospica acidithermotolerans]